MKKSYIYVTAVFIVIISVIFTSCSKSQKYVDNNGTTHILVTDEENQVITHKNGYVYEEVTGIDGSTMTRLMEYPTVSTNKNSSVMENFALKMDVPKGWKNTGYSNVFRIHHSGKCVDFGSAPCEIEVGMHKNGYYKEFYDENKKDILKLHEVSSNFTDIKEYTAEISGKTANVISYHIDSEKVTNFCYYIQNGYAVIEIKVLIYDECYNGDSIVELLNSCVTFKDLGEDYNPEAQTASEEISTATAQ